MGLRTQNMFGHALRDSLFARFKRNLNKFLRLSVVLLKNMDTFCAAPTETTTL